MPDGYGTGQAEEDYGYLRGDLVTGFDMWRGAPYFTPAINIPLGDIYTTIAAGIAAATPVPVPEIFPTVVIADPGLPDTEDVGPETVLSSAEVIDPDEAPTYTVYEEPREWIPQFPNPFENTAPTDWDRVYDEYVVLNAPVIDELPQPTVVVPPVPTQQEEDMPATDWGDILGGIASAIFQPAGMMADYAMGLQAGPPAAAGPTNTGTVAAIPQIGATAVPGTCPPVGPRYGKICLATGQVMPLRQRRRRRLLTSSDLSDLAALKAIVGNSAGMQAAVVKAVRR